LAWHLSCTGKSSTTTAFFDTPKTAMQEASCRAVFLLMKKALAAQATLRMEG